MRSVVNIAKWSTQLFLILGTAVTLLRLLQLLFQFSDTIERLYNRTDFVGRLTRQFLRAPRSSGISPHKKHSPKMAEAESSRLHRPHLSLRWLASYENIGYIMTCFLLQYMWIGLGPVGFVICAIIYILLYGSFKAVFSPSQSPSHKPVKRDWTFYYTCTYI